LTHALVAEPYSSDQVRRGALPAVLLYSGNRVPRAGRLGTGGTRWRHEERPWDASARLHAATCSFERWTGRFEHLAGAVCKSPTDILTESVVVMEWKGMSTSIATQCRSGQDVEQDARGASAESALLGPMSSIEVILW